MNDFFIKIARNIANTNYHVLKAGSFIYVQNDTTQFLGKVEELSKDSIQITTIPSPKKEIALEKRIICPFSIGNRITVSHVESSETIYEARKVYVQPPHKISAKGETFEFYYQNTDFMLEKIISELDIDLFFENIPRGLSILKDNFTTNKENTQDNQSIGRILYSN
ncbi:MAG: hypothetical protein ACMXYK_05145 [Candidatus Woesearchaeota archaeon]